MINWQTATVGDIATVGAGNPAPQKKEFFDSGIYPFVRTSDVGKIRIGSIDSAADKLNDKGIAKLKLFPAGTILFPKSGASTFLNHRVRLDRDAYVSSHLATIKANPKLALDGYLHYYLTTIKAQDLIQDHKYPSLKISDIKNISVSLPPLPEQKRIVAILDEAFAGIDAAVTNTEKNLANARELFESYLNAVFTQKGEGWEEKTLGDYSASISTGPFGSLLHKSDYVSTGVPLVNPINIDGRNIVPNNSKLIDEETKKRLQNYILHQGDIVIARRGEIGRCAVIDCEQDGWICGTGCFFMRPLPSVNPHFLAHLIRSQEYREKLEHAATGATMKNLSNKTLSNLLVAIPSIERQTEILANFDGLASETQRLEIIYQQKLKALTELKQSILQKAFAGELTSLPEKTLAEAVA